MKKKLVALCVLGYVGGSFSGEPLSPFGPNPFASHEEENPFQMPHREEFHQEPITQQAISVSPALNVEDRARHSEGVNENNPFASHLSFHSPEEEHARHFDMQEQQPKVAAQPEEVPFAFNQTSSEKHSQQSFSQPDNEPNSDTGEAAVVDSEVDTFEQEGSGNWLLKRVWWEKTEVVYEQIKQVFNEIMGARMDYISQRNRLDRELDVSNGQIGLEEGELQDIIDYCLDFVKKEKPEQGFLNKQQEDLYNALQHKQHDLEQIKLDLKALQAVDQKIDEALDTLFKQIDVANQYEQKAWENFKDIARELNDKVARKSYYETEGLLKDIKSVHTYIIDQFSSYFNQTLQTARTHSQSISSQVQTLKQAGIDLKQQVGILEQTQEAERLKKELAEHEKESEGAEKKKEVKKNAKTDQSMGMVSRLVDSVKLFVLNTVDHILDAALAMGSRIKSLFVKEESIVKAREKKLKVNAKIEDKKKKDVQIASKEDAHLEQVIHAEEHEVGNAVEQVVGHEEAALKTAVLQEEARAGQILVSKADRVERDFVHPVSVMPQERSHEAAHDSVVKFGHPPAETSINHPAFSHNPVQSSQLHEEKLHQEGHPISPFAK